MTLQDFSNNFTVLLDSYGESPSFGKVSSERRIVLNEYEKSVFLTMAQNEIVADLYSGKNVFDDSFESSEELRRYLDPLVLTTACEKDMLEREHISTISTFYSLPSNLAYIVYEQATISGANGCCSQSSIVDVVPVSHDEFERLKRNPFRNANDRRVLRLDAGEGCVEIVSEYEILEYKIRYIMIPPPIILEDLVGTGVSVNGSVFETECILNPVLHDIILKRAVQLAINTKVMKTN